MRNLSHACLDADALILVMLGASDFQNPRKPNR
jgi:hypothetical protein